MVENVSMSENSYIKTRMAQLPERQKGQAVVVKKGDCLWNIAKERLDKNAKNSEISDFMLSIAKLNGLNTKEKMDNLKVNETIYLPSETQEAKPAAPKQEAKPAAPKQEAKPAAPKQQAKPAAPKQEAKPAAPKQQAKPAAPKQEAKPVAPKQKATPVAPKTKAAQSSKTESEKSLSERINTVLTDKSISIRKSDVVPIDGSKLYFVHRDVKDESTRTTTSRPIMSFVIDKNGNMTKISFSSDNDKYKYGYDYTLNPSSSLEIKSNDMTNKHCGNADRSEIQALERRLKSLIEQ